MAIHSKPQVKHGEGGSEKSLINDKAQPLLLHLLPYLLILPNIQNFLMDASPFNRQWQKEGESMSPSSYQI
jgi:hypothetical protein